MDIIREYNDILSSLVGSLEFLRSSGVHFIRRAGGTQAALRAEIASCTRCVDRGDGNKVWGAGEAASGLVIVLSAPCTKQEDMLLANLLKKSALDRDKVYVTCAFKCPEQEHGDLEAALKRVSLCRGFLLQELSAISFRVIVAFGECAGRALLDDETLKYGTFYDYNGAKLMLTHGLAALDKQKELRNDTWAHMQSVLREMDE
jgi:uracil-DNA glycosylase family 4